MAKRCSWPQGDKRFRRARRGTGPRTWQRISWPVAARRMNLIKRRAAPGRRSRLAQARRTASQVRRHDLLPPGACRHLAVIASWPVQTACRTAVPTPDQTAQPQVQSRDPQSRRRTAPTPRAGAQRIRTSMINCMEPPSPPPTRRQGLVQLARPKRIGHAQPTITAGPDTIHATPPPGEHEQHRAAATEA